MINRFLALMVWPILVMAGPALAQSVPAMASAPSATKPASAPVVAAPQAVAGRAEWAVAAGARVKPTIGSLDPNTGYFMQVDVAAQGASVYTLKLSDYFTTVYDQRLFKKLGRDEQAYEIEAAKDPAKYKGHYSLLNPVPPDPSQKHLPMETRSIRVSGPGIDDLKWNLGAEQWKLLPPAAATPATAPADEESISMEWTLYRDPHFADAAKPAEPKPFLRLVKTYTLKKNSYSLLMSLKVENLSGLALEVTIDQAGPTGVDLAGQATDMREAAAGKFNFADAKVDTILKRVDDLGKAALDQPIPLGKSKEGLLWVGQTNKYFGSMMYLVSPRLGADPKPDQLPAVDYPAEFYFLPVRENSDKERTWATGVTLTKVSLAAGGTEDFRFDIFAGPKKRDMLEDKGDEPAAKKLYADLHYIGTIDLGGGSSCSTWCTFSWLTFGMMWLLEKFAMLAFGNYGVAIIILVVLVRVALHPLTKKGQVSMSKMQKLGPEMAKIKEKYANDKETLNREMMKAYKQQGATPILGCLPMFLQMPIWIALWTALSNSIELRQQAFLPVWIVDLSAPDTLIAFSQPLVLPLIGQIHGLNLLPLLLTIAMFLQTKLTPMSAAPATPEAKTQQKMMMYMMPLMMLFIFYGQPSGLTLYIMASTFAGVAEQVVIKKHIKQKEAEEAASGALVVVPGRGARGSRPKKPKGPGWIKHK